VPLIPNLSLYLIQIFDRLALWGNLTILELHFAETQDKTSPYMFPGVAYIFCVHSLILLRPLCYTIAISDIFRTQKERAVISRS
jgi:hypothetical protein